MLLYVLSDATASIPEWFVAAAPFFLALFVRAAAWTYRLALPRWARKTQSFGIFVPSEPKLELQLAPAKMGDDNK